MAFNVSVDFHFFAKTCSSTLAFFVDFDEHITVFDVSSFLHSKAK